MEKLIEGVVLEVNQDIATVKISRHSECSNCGACPGDNAIILEAIDAVGSKAGQHVLIKSKETNMLLAAFLVYIFPLIAIALGVVIGYYLSFSFTVSSTLLMTLGGVILGLAAIVLIKRLDLSLQSEKPMIIKTIK